jgi:RNA polymerase sigma factor for flagellar operon FliA
MIEQSEQHHHGFEENCVSKEQRTELIRMHLPLVDFVVDRVAPNVPAFLSRDDLKGAAMTGLMEAANRFDPSRGYQFKTFAEHRMRGAVFDEIRKMDWFSRSMREKQSRLHRVIHEEEERLGRTPDEQELAGAMGLSLDEYRQLLNEVGHLGCVSLNQTLGDSGEGDCFQDTLEDHRALKPQDSLETLELTDIMAKQLEKLSEKERLVVSLYYYEELSQKEIAQVLELTEGRISQLHSQALHKLKVKMDKAISD